MSKLLISVKDRPSLCLGMAGIRLVLQTKKEYVEGVNGVFTVDLSRAMNRKGEEHWVGNAVHFHGDGRRFIYLAWLTSDGQMFRRIKLYLNQIPGLSPESEEIEVTINGQGKDGSPACSTAILV